MFRPRRNGTSLRPKISSAANPPELISMQVNLHKPTRPSPLSLSKTTADTLIALPDVSPPHLSGLEENSAASRGYTNSPLQSHRRLRSYTMSHSPSNPQPPTTAPPRVERAYTQITPQDQPLVLRALGVSLAEHKKSLRESTLGSQRARPTTSASPRSTRPVSRGRPKKPCRTAPTTPRTRASATTHGYAMDIDWGYLASKSKTSEYAELPLLGNNRAKSAGTRRAGMDGVRLMSRHYQAIAGLT
ncbi:retinal rod [Carpediemonas membranifera]|uniref:Retinal rod n=1 Tax=Carpediemonas membranifera TaxID=201153 RepID=A0A8J6B4Q4_9EUKA|nr:retinal rod [Carpediemonas membranifera]|eukprot:KAG9392837.1 retinal rod [Carpediemonas membranifera]